MPKKPPPSARAEDRVAVRAETERRIDECVAYLARGASPTTIVRMLKSRYDLSEPGARRYLTFARARQVKQQNLKDFDDQKREALRAEMVAILRDVVETTQIDSIKTQCVKQIADMTGLNEAILVRHEHTIEETRIEKKMDDVPVELLEMLVDSGGLDGESLVQAQRHLEQKGRAVGGRVVEGQVEGQVESRATPENGDGKA